jgi:type I restriction enzyme R subunit
MTIDTSEKGLESLIARHMAGTGYGVGNAADYDREYCLDLAQLTTFLRGTQPEVAEASELGIDGASRRALLARIQGEISKRGTIDVLRHGIKHGPHHVTLFYGTPSVGNAKAAELNAANRFTVTRQLRYSRSETQNSLDLGLFINGLPIATFELKNSLTKQTVADAVKQYQQDRDPGEKLFEFGRCIAHFAVDDTEVRFCTHLTGKNSWFLPFNLGWNDGAGNPPNPDGLKTAYLWERVLTRAGLTDILENYAQVIEFKDEASGKKKRTQIWPRYHQLDVVRKLLADVRASGAGRRYLIQHSAGSGKSNSIAWLAHQLIGATKDEKNVFESIIVVTDRTILDSQIRDTIKQYAQVGATIGHADSAADLRTFIAEGRKIIITTVQKFPFILDEIGTGHRGRTFAIIIDEAHSSQGGSYASAVATALSTAGAENDNELLEDKINRIMEAKKLLPNASYFAFTATPKNKTLEIFGDAVKQPEGKIAHRPFHSYTMKQAIEEGFILDVLRYYTPVESFYKLVKKIEGDPEFDARRAQKKLRKYVESHEHAIRLKAEIMVDHFQSQVLSLSKIGGEARAMVVTSGIERAVQYYHAFQAYLSETKSPYRAIVAFSGEHEFGGVKVTEGSLNSFPSGQIAQKIKEDPYRFLICADKFQTGYDEPLLHTMYVDKVLSGVKAVQTLSRLNRSHPKKHDVFVLDFMNDTKTIEESFADYYRTTVLAEETDPNKLHDLKAELDAAGVYTPGEIDLFVERYLGDSDRTRLDPVLDLCVERYLAVLDENGQVDFKSKAKAFLRAYGFLSSILPYSNPEWEKLSILLTFLVPKLPAPVEDDLSRGILETIDMDSYRLEKLATMRIGLPDQEGIIEPVPTTGGGHINEPALEPLSVILRSFNDQFGSISWLDEDRVRQMITEQIPARVAQDQKYIHAQKNSDKQNARIEHDAALGRVMTAMLNDDTELFKQFMDNESFRGWLKDTVFGLTYKSTQP